MIIGLVGFGEVSYNLTRIIKSKEHIFATSTENRSQKTVELIKDSGIEIFETFKELASASDILISANSPKSALEVAEKYPLWQFEKHKGYGTKLHYDALREHGPSPIHRMSFLKKLYG